MKKLFYLFPLFLLTGIFFQACDDYETYAEMKEKEREAIRAFIKEQNIKEISLEQFYKQDSLTNVEENEYVLFPDNGVYMQIVRKGTGGKMEEGERTDIYSRYVEMNIKSRDTLSGNLFDAANPDVFTLTYKNGSYTGSFTQGYMNRNYGSSVPSGWLVPMPYINLGRKLSDLAKVRLIVPHSQGQSTATQYVYPCYYEITYQKGR